MQRDCLAVLVAAGEGNRLGRPEGKAMVALAGRPMFFYSLEQLLDVPTVRAIALVVRALDQDLIASAVDQMRPGERAAGRVQLVPGGLTRQESVYNGLEALAGLPGPATQAVVLIQDAARPLLSAVLIDAVLSAARHEGESTVVAPVLPVVDALRLAETTGQIPDAGETAQASLPARESLRLMQTPQAGHLCTLLAAHRWALSTSGGAGFADDVSLAEAYGLRVKLVSGERRNIKVTIPEDLELAESLIKSAMLPRTGIGFDIHPLRTTPGGMVRLGGVSIPADLELVGHSDADVAAHAAMDAILGAGGAGDIGIWFPPGAPEWRGADSMHLLRIVWTGLAGQGFVFGNLDLTIQAERPRLSPHYQAMRQNLAQAIGCRPDDISIKATTMEGLGAIGCGEGIAAMAVATLFAGTHRPGFQAGLGHGEMNHGGH